jgi:hypothetical protein
MVALAAIFIDASVGDGLTWENDPYWTYWVTKTFLIATIFGLGTAWFGIGAGRGAIITAVHTIVLTVYYWTFSPIGLPSTSRDAEYPLMLEIGNDTTPIPGEVSELVATWNSYEGSAPEGAAIARYVGGGAVLLVSFGLGLALTSRPRTPRRTVTR